MADADDNARHAPAGPQVAPLRRPRGRRLAIPAFFIALVSVMLAVIVVVRTREESSDVSSTTSAIGVAPISGGSTAQSPLVTTPSPVVVASTPPAGEQLVLTTAQEAETFVRSYYDANRGPQL